MSWGHFLPEGLTEEGVFTQLGSAMPHRLELDSRVIHIVSGNGLQ